MRHGKKGFKLGRTRAHRKATLVALSNALIKNKSIRTTLTKARATRTFVEPLITRSKEDTMHNRRVVFSRLSDKVAVTELFVEIAERVGDRPGGYTRIVKIGQRSGDGAEMAVIELVDYNETATQTISRRRRRTRRAGRRRARRGAAEAALVREQEAATEETPLESVAEHVPSEEAAAESDDEQMAD